MSRPIALRILLRVEKEGLYAAPLLDRTLEHSRLSPLDKALTTELVYGTLRWQGRLDAILSPFLRSPLQRMDPLLRGILRISLYQLFFLDRIPAFAVVDEAVKLATSCSSPRQADFVNAILRRIAEQRPSIGPPGPSSDPAHWVAYYSHPEELIKKWIHDWGEEQAAALMEANNQIPELGLQVNAGKADPSTLLCALQGQVEQGEEGRLVPNFLRVRGLWGIRHSPPYRKGWFQIMDEGSALIPHLLRPQPGEEILDACAGKGGKAALLAQLMENRGRILAVDLNRKALQMLKENARRMGLFIIEPLCADVREAEALRGKRFPRILLDAPCSGLGTLRRHPEIKWRNPLASLPRLRALQLSLLEAGASHLSADGVLLYSTCSPEPEEDEEVIAEFLRSHASLRVEDLSPYLPRPLPGLITPQGYLRTFPHRHRTDAFFAARLRRCGP
ncbi:MAG: 16S rRNA (cytosine(967)-C(5))-methyltransferase RsmB [candidate division NC10 bacterium]|nr:16S rRNA (cytosine(967)-C(5))-methyltransferase RsmB [candidate division NC10 bacterium]